VDVSSEGTTLGGSNFYDKHALPSRGSPLESQEKDIEACPRSENSHKSEVDKPNTPPITSATGVLVESRPSSPSNCNGKRERDSSSSINMAIELENEYTSSNSKSLLAQVLQESKRKRKKLCKSTKGLSSLPPESSETSNTNNAGECINSTATINQQQLPEVTTKSRGESEGGDESEVAHSLIDGGKARVSSCGVLVAAPMTSGHARESDSDGTPREMKNVVSVGVLVGRENQRVERKPMHRSFSESESEEERAPSPKPEPKKRFLLGDLITPRP